jgi:hypothetical protein
MTPDDIRDDLRTSFPNLVAVQRRDGWSFFYEEQVWGARIITATRSSSTATTRLLRAVSSREEEEQGYEPFGGGPEQLHEIVAAEIARFHARGTRTVMSPSSAPAPEAILFSANPAQADMRAAFLHLEQHRDLYFSVRYRIQLPPPLLGFVHVSGDQVRYVAYIQNIVDYHPRTTMTLLLLPL